MVNEPHEEEVHPVMKIVNGKFQMHEVPMKNYEQEKTKLLYLPESDETSIVCN